LEILKGKPNLKPLTIYPNYLTVSVLQVKSGKTFLKDYYLKHRALSEKDLDDLVTKSSMSYEQVRDWFSETARRVEEGKEPFSEEEAEGEEEDEEEEEEEEEEVEVEVEGVAAADCVDSEGEMEVREQGEEASDEDCIKDEKKEGPEDEDDEAVQEESEGVGQSEPQAEEQT